jgi:structure-specific endonuclease subunit SLX1
MTSNSKHYCYILKNNNRTYIGYTVDPNRRIKQHNGVLKGGAKATSALENWEFLCILTSDDAALTKNLALSIEWNLKHPLGKIRDKTFNGVDGKIKTLNTVLPRYKMLFTIWIREEYIDKIQNEYFQVKPLDDFSNLL